MPAASVHDGYVDFSDLTYDVYLNGGKIGTTRDTELSYTLPQGQPFTSYTAEIVASYKGWASPTATSNFITYGDPLKMPVHFRPLEKQLEMMTLIKSTAISLKTAQKTHGDSPPRWDSRHSPPDSTATTG